MQRFSPRSLGISGILALALLIFAPLLVHAQAVSAALSPGFQIFPTACNCPGTAPAWGCILATFQNLMNAMVAIATVILTIFIALAGFTYMTSGGSAEKRQLANKRIMNAVIGLLIVLCAWLLVDSIMKVIYNPNAAGLGPWNSILGANGGADCLAITAAPSALPALNSPSNGLGGAATAGAAATPASAVQNNRGACTASALTSTFGNNAAAMSCVTNYEDQSCNAAAPSGTDIGADGNVVSFGLFQVNISANNLSQFPACEATVNNQSLNCTQAFSGGAYTASNHNTRVSNQALYNTCVSAVTNATCNEQAAQTILHNQGIGAWGKNAQNNCSSLVN